MKLMLVFNPSLLSLHVLASDTIFFLLKFITLALSLSDKLIYEHYIHVLTDLQKQQRIFIFSFCFCHLMFQLILLLFF